MTDPAASGPKRHQPEHEHRELGNSGVSVTPVAMGCWPIAGMTSVHVNDQDSLATLHAALDHGITFFDTAYCYGPDGESERLLGRVIGGAGSRRDQMVLATKGGIHWDERGERVVDGRPETLRRELDESLRRLGTDRVELLYLHAPDPATPLAESAEALRQLRQAGKARAIGVSNFTVEQLDEFHAVCPITACQPPYNMLQRGIERDILPWCQARGIAVCVYWSLMKGLLAGRLDRDFQFEARDGRAKYPMFQGEEWRKNQDFLDELRAIAADCGKTVAQVVVNWTIHQPGITVALCGAKRAYQIEESAGAMGWRLSSDQTRRIDQAIARRGEAKSRSAV